MPETNKRPLKVFLCHAHADRDSVRGLYTRLTKDGVDAWLDKEKLLPGQDWELEIRKAVREADVVVVCLSKQFNQAGFRQKEVRLALDTAMEKPEGEIFIIPARLEECNTLESLRKWHWVDLYEEDGYDKLLRTLHIRADRIGAITYSLIRFGAKAERERKINFLLGQAEKLEEARKWADAIDIYRQIQRIDNSYAEINKKLETLQKKLNGNISTLKFPKINTTRKLQMSWFPITGSVALLIGCCLVSIVGMNFYTKFTKTATLTASQSNIASLTSTPTADSIVEVTSSPTDLKALSVAEIVDDVGSKMELVSSGNFIMGSDAGSLDEQPVQSIELKAFYIDKYEVTNKLYKACVDKGVCSPPKQSRSYTRIYYYQNTVFDDFPVVNVDWNMSKAFCEWRGARLPTEAEWEKAARGTDGRMYPWGDSIDCSFASYLGNGQAGCVKDTTRVGDYESGQSVYGVYDLAGNVWEWVSSLYRPYPYSLTDGREDVSADGEHVLRGGSWNADGNTVRSSLRFKYDGTKYDGVIGFRCAKSAVQ